MNSEATIETQFRDDLSAAEVLVTDTNKQYRTTEIGKKNYFQGKEIGKIPPFHRIFQIPFIYAIFEHLEPLTR